MNDYDTNLRQKSVTTESPELEGNPLVLIFDVIARLIVIVLTAAHMGLRTLLVTVLGVRL